jgi:aldehyde:ferredoxin oxidoreductase
MTGRDVIPEDLIQDSQRVYNFQKIFCIRQGKGLRINDLNFPYRAMGPVTVKEYESRVERYDKQLKDIIGIDPSQKTTQEKILILRQHRELQYEKLVDIVYKQRGWNKNGCPSKKIIQDLELALPEILEIIQPFQE